MANRRQSAFPVGGIGWQFDILGHDDTGMLFAVWVQLFSCLAQRGKHYKRCITGEEAKWMCI